MQLSGRGHDRTNQSDDTLSHLAAIGEISAGIAHEVRNPLTAVKGFLQLLEKEIDHKYLKIASAELENALQTLNDLLHVSKPGLVEEPFENVKPSTELESVISLFQDQFLQVKVIKKFRDEGTVIRGKRNAIKKALFNLLKNAFEAIDGEGTITIEHYVSGEHLHIVIADTGIGIPEDKLPLLGAPFFTMKSSGTGIGLALVYATFYEHGATIDVESKVGEGTKFIIKLPIPKERKIEVTRLEKLKYAEGESFLDFLKQNKEQFDRRLQDRTETVVQQAKDEELFGEEKFEETANKIITWVEEEAEHALIAHAKKRGIAWAKSDLPASIKLEWYRGFCEVYWDFLYNYYKKRSIDLDSFFQLEKRTNHLLDVFLNHFFITYNKYTKEVLSSQREVIDSLMVPVIPLTGSTAILPIIGTIDTYRAKRIQEKTLKQVADHRLKKIIIDLSAVAFMDTAVVSHLFKIVEGLSLLGCKAVVTGIRAEIANTMVEMGIEITKDFTVYGDLQQALEENPL